MITLKDFGVLNASSECQTKRIQQAIDAASSSGEELVIEKGVYITGTLFLRSNLTIRFEKGAYFLGSENFADYSDNVDLFTDAVDHQRGRSLIYADSEENISIYGEGVIDGRGEIFSSSHPNHLERPFLVRIMNSSNISISDVTLKKSAAWTLHLLNCENISVKDISIHSRVNGNNDGIDIGSCRGCNIDGCSIDTGDDAICLKSTFDMPCRDISVTNCTITTNWAAFKIGTESVGDFENISFENSYIYDCNGCAIKICPVDGANLDGLTIKNIRLLNSTGPIFIAGGDRLRTYHKDNTRTTQGVIKNILIENISGICIDAVGSTYKGEDWGNAKSAICISGTEENHIDGITLKNICVSMQGGVTEYVRHNIPPMGKRYPEFHNFGILPAWGVYVRNTDNFTYENLCLEKRGDDIRPYIVTE